MTEPPTEGTPSRSILVTGDVVIDHQIYLGQQRRTGSTLRLGTVETTGGGGAALLSDLLRAVSESSRDSITLGVKEPVPSDLPASLQGYGVFKPFPALQGDSKSSQVWRLDDPLGFGAEPTERLLPTGDGKALAHDYDVVVIDDAGLGFRTQTSKEAWPRILRDADAKWPEWLVIKLSAPVACGDLWRSVAHLEQDGQRLRDRSVAIVSINDLRAEGAQVPQALSWEQTALDLTSELTRNPSLQGLSVCRYLIVAFHTDGGLLADFTDHEKPVFQLLFDAANVERDWAEAIPGTIYGLQTCLAAAVVHNLPHRTASPDEARMNIERGVTAGLAGMRRLLRNGHGCVDDNTPGFPFTVVANQIIEPTCEYVAVPIPDLDDPAREYWTILEGDEPSRNHRPPLFGTARRVAIRGAAELRHVPYQRFGQLFVIERNEIESLRSLMRLVREFRNDLASTKPLSIAVFGPPGAGKSFGVKQVAKSVLGPKTPILEFNLAQFDEPSELIGLLHQVRDKVLEGHLPVVFWDEFDSRELMWLQYLLAPMQDGRFQEGQISHPIGKCIFVFAGGTSHDFESFGPPRPATDSEEADLNRWHHFKAMKGPDFVSRLSGYLNVIGPNRRQLRDEQTGSWRDDPSDVSFPIRRALFIRAKLCESDSQRLAIDQGVLTALLEIGRYRHGSRSLEKLVEQLRQSSRTGVIQRSDLPPASMLNLCADEAEFRQLVERSRGFQENVEDMAEAVHDFYREKFPGGRYDGPYADLPEEIKEDNRAAAQRIPDVLALAGLYVAKSSAADSDSEHDEIKAILERNLDILAEAEHDGWMDFKLRQGWRPVANESERCDEKRLHHLLVPYQQLLDEEREKDRNAVRAYPEIVARKAYRIVAEPATDST